MQILLGVSMIQRLGTELAGYRLINQIGQGGFSDVYLGEKPGEGSTAIKILKMQLTTEGFRNFISEARMIRMSHPHIVKLIDFNVLSDNTPFFVMEYIQHGDLRKRHPKGATVPLHFVRSYIRQLASALQYAHQHQRIAHLDIKPENMLLRTPDHVVLSDFGIASLLDTGQDVPTRDPIGTIPYMSPEQIHGKPGFASDQYSLAVVIYEWLCGSRPFEGAYGQVISMHLTATPPSLKTRLPGLLIPPQVEQVLMRALAKDPLQRFPTIADFAAAFEVACGGVGDMVYTDPISLKGPVEHTVVATSHPLYPTGTVSPQSGPYPPGTGTFSAPPPRPPDEKKGLFNTRSRKLALLFIALAIIVAASSPFIIPVLTSQNRSQADTNAPILQEIHMGLIPSTDPEAKERNAQAFVDALEEELGRKVITYVGESYSDIIEELGRNKLDVVWFDTFSYVAAADKYNAQAILRRIVGGKPFYNSIIFTTRDTGITSLQDLKGKNFAFVDKYSTSGGLYPRYELTNAGINPDTDIQGSYAYQHENVLRSVLSGDSDAGAISSDLYESGQFAAILAEAGLTSDDIVILKTSDAIPQGPIAVRPGLNPQDITDITNAFLSVTDATTLHTIEVDGFELTDDASYDSVRNVANALNINLQEGVNEQ